MAKIYTAGIYCQNKECELYGVYQARKFVKLKDFYDKKIGRACNKCGKIAAIYTSATEQNIGITVKEVISILQKCNPEAVLRIDIAETNESGTVFDWAIMYTYDVYQTDNPDEVKLLYSPYKD